MFSRFILLNNFWKYAKPNAVPVQQQQQSSSSSISSLSSTSNISLTNPPTGINPITSPYSVTSSINDDPTVESTRLKIAHRLAI
ncbi:unnamed protein product [Rotaria sp. Silwood1]|nr:unnamed protein product [Rotaria sp. Silwood1]